MIINFRADIIEDIDKLVKYVESSDVEGANSSKRGAKHHQQQRRSTSGRTLNSKGNKSSEVAGVKKSNSLEEISTSKLEDLVIGKGDRRSWGTEDGEQYYCKKLQQVSHLINYDISTVHGHLAVKNFIKYLLKLFVRYHYDEFKIKIPGTEY